MSEKLRKQFRQILKIADAWFKQAETINDDAVFYGSKILTGARIVLNSDDTNIAKAAKDFKEKTVQYFWKFEEFAEGYIKAAKAAQAKEELRLAIEARLTAQQEAQRRSFDETKRHSRGPDSTTGKTIASIVEVASGNYWVGRSGISNHTVFANAQMTTLLKNVQQTEEWAVNVCAEVDAMKQALLANANENDLVFYCWTWNASTQKWTGKGACSNCKQWISKLGA